MVHTQQSDVLTVHTQQSDMLMVHTQQSDMLLVHRRDLDRLATETMMLKEFLPKLLAPDFLGALGKLTQREKGPEHALTRQCELTRILNQNYHRGTIHLSLKKCYKKYFSVHCFQSCSLWPGRGKSLRRNLSFSRDRMRLSNPITSRKNRFTETSLLSNNCGAWFHLAW